MTKIEYVIIEGKIKVVTGLHIGAGKHTVEIGGIDALTRKIPNTFEPYIPGSSLKGKMRLLMEWKYGLIPSIDNNGEIIDQVHSCKSSTDLLKCPVCRIFGSQSEKITKYPTRIIVRDCMLSKDSAKKFKDKLWSIFEIKNEIVTGRISSKATPRLIERVSPGVEFDLNIVLRSFDMQDNISNDIGYIWQSLALVQLEALGGSISRGYGKIEFLGLKWTLDNKCHDQNNIRNYLNYKPSTSNQ